MTRAFNNEYSVVSVQKVSIPNDADEGESNNYGDIQFLVVVNDSLPRSAHVHDSPGMWETLSGRNVTVI